PVPFFSGLSSLAPHDALAKLDLSGPALGRAREAAAAGDRNAALSELVFYYRRKFPLPADPPAADPSDIETADQLVRHQFQWGPEPPVDYGPVPLNWEK